MHQKYNFKKELIGNFGDPVWENPTEAMVEAAFAYHSLPYRYITTLVTADNLEAAFNGVKAMGYRGFNCTIPHKVAIIKYLDGLGESARIMQAVNCVVERNGKYIGENTDGKGFLQSLEDIRAARNQNVVIVGAGGAARAVAVELALAGATSVKIVNRSEERGEELVHLLRNRTGVKTNYEPLLPSYAIPADTDILINATNVGMYPRINQVVPVDFSIVPDELLVFDLVITPPMTMFLQSAQTAGCQTVDGLGMLVNQGKIAIKYWTGIEVDSAVMRNKLEEIYG